MESGSENAVRQGSSQTDEDVSRPPSPSRPTPEAINYATIQLLRSWRAQDATDDPEAIRAAEQELVEFKKAMNENRALAGEPPLYP